MTEKYVSGETMEGWEVQAEQYEVPSYAFGLPPSDLELRDDEIHIWFSYLDKTINELYHFSQMLSIDERMRMGRFHRDEDKKRFIVRHGILRKIFGGYIGVEPNDLQFYYDKKGKPSLLENLGRGSVQFNLSHSNGVAIFAFTRNHDIGVDIEYIREIPEMDKIVRRFFSEKENEAFRLLPDSQKRAAFFKGWTSKEAFVKALGDGLTRPLYNFDVSLSPNKSGELLKIDGDSNEAHQWSIQYLEPLPDFACAFAIRSKFFNVKCWQWVTS